MLLTSYPPLRRFYAATAANARFTRLVNVFVMRATCMAASILFRAKIGGVENGNFSDVFNGDLAEIFPMFIEVVQLINHWP
ncbi:transposase (fragment) [Vibrio crassostreae]|uniref:Transposase n=1 Tax=Vibrio crassostreae TaxID=246167 RepID=A0ABM9QXC1_9VIBR|nr:hypothetical protein EDB39_114119 [Vibrio crassostreae]TCT54133.1 hypothetical protein EDB40_11419 [Vibrio crassostreae]TCT58986.1 hypothetical protein EDB44_118122 [Vibrio crassostreae]TCT80301.1 hypothetical protein EDB43_118122 [Vibrio crassostreae]TCU01561.1 hypothetical protein EDB47_11757 [Vibrio crassostreae]